MGAVWRRATAVLAFAAAALLALNDLTVRSWEIHATAWLSQHVLGIQTLTTVHRPDVFWFRADGLPWSGIQITAECTSAVLLTPLMVVVGVLLLAKRMSVPRVLLAAAAAGGSMLVVNLARFVGLVAALTYGGHAVFDWAHVVGGTVLTMLGALAGLFLFGRIVVVRQGHAG
jgi:exosortase/archaeosortase family protein